MVSRLFCCCSSASSPPPAHEIEALYKFSDGHSSADSMALDLRLFIAMWCRSSAERFTMQKQLDKMGSRQAKLCCWVHDSDSGSGGVMGWMFPGSSMSVLSASACSPSVGLHSPALESVLKTHHPVLLPIRLVDISRPDRAVLLRDWCPAGSIRDVLHGAKPEGSQTSKYDRVGTPLSEAKIASLGRALLEALIVLRPLGTRVMHHVHLGNCFLNEAAEGLGLGSSSSSSSSTGALLGRGGGGGGGGGHTGSSGSPAPVRIAEWEQGLLGLPSHLEPYFADLKRCLEPAACALALCIYEMACGFELDGLPPVVPPTCPRSVREALDEMFRGPQRATSSSPREKRAACFTLEDCRSLPLFSGSVGPAVALEWEPLPSDMVKVALEVAKSTAAST